MDLVLTKDEVPIWGQTGFDMPIHPRLLDPQVRFDPQLAKTLFTQASDEVYDDVKKHLRDYERISEENQFLCQRFLDSGRPRIERDSQNQILVNAVSHWQDRVNVDNRGFVTSFSVSPSGGCIYFSEEDRHCETGIELSSYEGRALRLSKEKASSLIHRTTGKDWGLVWIYGQHNLDFAPCAIFLRNWSLAYVNAAMKSIA